jgi:hypothetical protein
MPTLFFYNLYDYSTEWLSRSVYSDVKSSMCVSCFWKQGEWCFSSANFMYDACTYSLYSLLYLYTNNNNGNFIYWLLRYIYNYNDKPRFTGILSMSTWIDNYIFIIQYLIIILRRIYYIIVLGYPTPCFVYKFK